MPRFAALDLGSNALRLKIIEVDAARSSNGPGNGRRRWQAFAAAYEAQRADGVLPASYEVVYGHAWSPPDKHAAHGGAEVPLASLTLPDGRGPG